MDKLQKEMEQLKEQRNQHKQLADSNARQRDMYKALLTQSTGYTLPPQGKSTHVSGIFKSIKRHEVGKILANENNLSYVWIKKKISGFHFTTICRTRFFPPRCTSSSHSPTYSLHASKSSCCRVGTDRSG